MQRSPCFRLSLGVFSALTLLAPGCDEEHSEDVVDDEIVGEQADPLDPPTSDPGLVLAGLDRDFADAADEFGVPTPLLQAIGHVETRWQMIEGLSEFEGQEPAFGVMARRPPRAPTTRPRSGGPRRTTAAAPPARRAPSRW